MVENICAIIYFLFKYPEGVKVSFTVALEGIKTMMYPETHGQIMEYGHQILGSAI